MADIGRPGVGDPAQPVPPRVLAAERRREFRELLTRGSLGCPLRACDHLIGDHDADYWDDDGDPVNPRCQILSCDCGDDDD